MNMMCVYVRERGSMCACMYVRKYASMYVCVRAKCTTYIHTYICMCHVRNKHAIPGQNPGRPPGQNPGIP
jgi:hypothetical protein